MNIHHATIKRATANSITLEQAPDGERFQAHDDKADDVTIVCATAKDAINHVLLQRRFGTEYENVVVREGQTMIDQQVVVEFDPTDFSVEDVFVDTLEAAEEAGLETELEGDDEERGGGVVPASYRQEYAARGDANHNGDWLAVTLVEAFTMEDDKRTGFDSDGFTACLEQNGVELSGKWADLPNSGQKGWQGRYRMNGRQKLEIRVAVAGVLLIGDAKITPDADWLAAAQWKHRAHMPKTEEAEAA